MSLKFGGKIIAVAVAAVFILQTLVGGLGFLVPVSAAGCTTYPCSSSVTVLSYNGVDSNALSDLNAGKISAYDFQLTPVEASSLPSSYGTMAVPNSLYEVLVNPENTSWSGVQGFTGTPFNIFYYPQIRAALNYILNRAYLVDNILGGEGVPILSVYGVAPDSLTVANGTAPYSSYLSFNPSAANSTFYSTLTAVSGVSYVNHKYYYQNNPITVYIIDRTDDPFREAYAGYLSTELQNLGFTVVEEPMNLAIVRTTVFSENPVNGTGGTPPTPWDIYVGAFSNVFLYYGDGLQVCFDGANCAAGPYSDNCGPGDLANGAWNTTAETPPDIIKLSCELDQLNNQILAGTYTSPAQRAQVLTNYTQLEIQMGVNDWLATGLNVYGYNPAQITGLSASFVASPVMGTVQSWMTMTPVSTPSSCSSLICLGARYLTQYNMNPVGGYGDAYSADLLAGVFPGLVDYGPSTAYPWPFGWTYTLNKISSNTTSSGAPIPTTAINYNATTGKWYNIPAGRNATLDVTVNFNGLMANDAYSDNESITLADFLYAYVVGLNATTAGNAIYDSAVASSAVPGNLATVLGMKILNSTAIELYSSYFFFDPVEAVMSAVSNITPFRNAGMPWTMYQAMSDLVASHKDAWAQTTAKKEGLPWLTLVGSGTNGNPTDISNLATDLSSRASQNFIPGTLSQIQSVDGGVSVLPSGYSAATEFTNAYKFITVTTGNTNALIGYGPFYVKSYQASTTPNYATLNANPNFKLSPYLAPQLFAPATVISVSTTVPTTVTPGTSIPITTISTPIGQKTGSPQSGANVVVQLVGNTSVVSQTKLVSGTGGVANYVVPNVAPGPYTLVVYANSVNSSMLVPYIYSTTIITAISSSSSSSSSSSASSSSSSASTASSSTTGISLTTVAIVAGVVIVIIIAATVVLFMRRKPPTPT